MNVRPVLILAALLLLPSSATAFELTDSFIAYMKTVTNPHDFGLRDQRYFPYSTRYGRRIGFGRPVTDKSLYTHGESPAAADQELRLGLARTVDLLRTALTRSNPGTPFDGLDRRAQEILLDHAYTEGVGHLHPDFVEIVLRSDWDTLLDRHLYIRGLGNWPDTIKNRAFGLRWIYGSSPNTLRPLRRISTP